MTWDRRWRPRLGPVALVVGFFAVLIRAYELFGEPICLPCDPVADGRCAMLTAGMLGIAFPTAFLYLMALLCWWENRAPSWRERMLWGLALLAGGVLGAAAEMSLLYYALVYRRIDNLGQYRLMKRI